MRIKIKKTPPGFAPEEIREQWVGLILPCIGKEDPHTSVDPLFRTGTENIGGYQVATADAIKALEDAKLFDALKFWSVRLFGAIDLTFKADICEVLDDEKDDKNSAFSQKFWEKWYESSDDFRQVVSLEKLQTKPKIQERRTDSKVRYFSALDMFVYRLGKGSESSVIFSKKKICKLLGRSSSLEVSLIEFKDCIDQWCSEFGLKLIVFTITFDKKKNYIQVDTTNHVIKLK